ncbi:ParB/RepB/Spo0J family partition protein [Methylocystis parvus]|uniref:ParB/RepB/Spo0J family partition protein n=1 Tax=Methylocystis parvus TaxID=134 RepID=UPI003C753A68
MTTLNLSDIAGLSRFNARQSHAAEDIDELIGSIMEMGVTEPLLVRNEDGETRVLNGGRRLMALRRLAENDALPRNFGIPVAFFEGTDEEAFEASLISFVQRRDLHPVDEFERFVELRDRFHLDETAIARKTGKSVRFVKERLRLARLSSKVREAWRTGRIVAEVAQAFSASESHETQDAILEEPDLRYFSAESIRRELRGENAVRADDGDAIFVGLDAYVAAGGRVDEQLFEEDSWLLDPALLDPALLDPALLDRLAREKLEALGEQICAEEGWGFVTTDLANVGYSAQRQDLTEEEEARLNEIDATEPADDAEQERLDKERLDIETRAILRAFSQEDRAQLGVCLFVDSEGAVVVERGVSKCAPEIRSEHEEEAPARAPSGSASFGAAPAAAGLPASEPIGKSLKAVLDETAEAALGAVVARNPRLAMIYAVAAMACSYGREAMELSGVPIRGADLKSELLAEIAHKRFEQALARCAEADADPALIPVAFAEIMSHAFRLARANLFDQAQVMLAVASRQSDIRGALCESFDQEAFFKASPRDIAVDAIRAIDGEAAAAEAGKLKKPELVKRAALLAKDRFWLPAILDDAVRSPEEREAAAPAPDARSTAEAMRDAIEADETTRPRGVLVDEIVDGCEVEERATAEARVLTFIELCCARGGEKDDVGKTKAATLYAAFVTFSEMRNRPPMTLAEFGSAVATLGIEKKRVKNGVHYLNIALAESGAAQAAE